ncbi:hypothetical protein CIPAW_05G026600 [Carya illinoinensis]|uniref:Uncharacterized protein n=1 Tax=Carya illinoinensis TaxID=32201 RepID=A0A8T1QEP9_CARIL|nr:hypothetical protein CIPAW_05G026600 [Carya illinoinensis]
MERVNPCFFPNFRISDSRPPNTYPVFNPPFPPIHHCLSLNYSQISSFQIPNFIFVSYLSVKNLHIYIYIYISSLSSTVFLPHAELPPNGALCSKTRKPTLSQPRHLPRRRRCRQ